VALLVIAADQFTKIVIRSFPEGWRVVKLGFLRIVHISNTGAAFGLFQGYSFALTIVALIGILVILFLALSFSSRLPFLSSWLGKLSLGLMLGGAVGNLIDRVHLGYVTDFIDLGFWPAFNVADSAITVGVIIFAYVLLRSLQSKTGSST